MRKRNKNSPAPTPETNPTETPFKRRNDEIALAQQGESRCQQEYQRAIAKLNSADPLELGYEAMRDRARSSATELTNARERLRLCLNGQDATARPPVPV